MASSKEELSSLLQNQNDLFEDNKVDAIDTSKKHEWPLKHKNKDEGYYEIINQYRMKLS